MADPLIDRSTFPVAWSRLHGGAGTGGIVGWWLGVSYRLARPLARLGVAPDVVTAAAVALAWAAVWPSTVGGRAGALGVAAAVAASGVADGVDGAVALLRGRATRWGFVLDSAADRVAEAGHLTALWLLGAPAGLCVAAGAVGALFEYVRARAGAAGLEGLAVITVAERPTRLVVTAAFPLGVAVLPGWRVPLLTTAAAALVAVSAVGLGQLARAVRRALRDG